MTVGFMAQDPTVTLGHDDLARLRHIGNNTGNRAFAYAMSQHVDEDIVYLDWTRDPAEVRERCRVLVIPEASAANPIRDFSSRALFIEAVGLPVVVAGLGAQARRIGDPVPLSDGTLRYLRAIASRCDVVGVRGEFSAEVLGVYGIGNTVVVGCPSNFIDTDPTLGARIETKIAEGRFQRVAVTQGDQKVALRDVERHLVGWVRSRSGSVIYQSGSALLAARADTSAIGLREQAKVRAHLGIRPWHSWGAQPMSRLVGVETHVFFGISDWLEYLSAMDLAIGTRIHGNILAIQAGTPGACVHHDSRTEELCRTTLIPNLTVEQCNSASTPEAAMSATRFSGDAYDRNRAQLATTYRDLLRRGGLVTSPDLDALCDAPTD